LAIYSTNTANPAANCTGGSARPTSPSSLPYLSSLARLLGDGYHDQASILMIGYFLGDKAAH
jgi:hypothetical protein